MRKGVGEGRLKHFHAPESLMLHIGVMFYMERVICAVPAFYVAILMTFMLHVSTLHFCIA